MARTKVAEKPAESGDQAESGAAQGAGPGAGADAGMDAMTDAGADAGTDADMGPDPDPGSVTPPPEKPERKPGFVQVPVKELRAAMKAVLEVVERRNTIPVLANVLLHAQDHALTLIATDLDIMVERRVEVADARAMRETVSAATLSQIAAKLPAAAIADIWEEDGKVTVSAGRARFVLPTLPADDLPLMTVPEWGWQFEMPAAELVAMIDRLRFAMSSEEARYYLSGIHWHERDTGELGFAATDGHRLSVMRMEMPEGGAGMPGIILPRKAVAILDKLLDGHGGVVDIALSEGRMRFDLGEVVLTTKLVVGTFPDYMRVIPAGNDCIVRFDPADLAEAVERVTVVSSDKTRAVRAEFSGDSVVLEVRSPDNGTGSEDVAVMIDGGKAVTIGFNGAYLTDILRHLTANEAEVLLGDPAAPTLWRDSADARAMFVLMPLRVA